MRKYKVITLQANDEEDFDMCEVNNLLNDGWQVQDIRMTSTSMVHSDVAVVWQTFVLYKE